MATKTRKQPEIRIREVEPGMLKILKKRAEKNNRTISSECKEIIEQTIYRKA